MTKTDFITSFSSTFNTTKKLAKEVYEWLGQEIKTQLVNTPSGEFNVFGLGKLLVKNRAQRVGRNPRTGEQVTIPARDVVKFRPGRGLR